MEAAWSGVLVGAATVLLGFLALVLLWGSRAAGPTTDAAAARAETAKAVAPKKGVTHHKAAPRAPLAAHHEHHPLCINTLKGHGDAVRGLAFTSDGRGLATACADGCVRVFKLEDLYAKSFKFLRINLPPGEIPVGVAFGEGASELVVGAQSSSGATLSLYGQGSGTAAAQAREQGKLPPPEVKWAKSRVHADKGILTLHGAAATAGSGDGTAVVASCSEGTDIALFHVADGRAVGRVDTSQLQNHMASLSPDGRFLAAAAFTADVKVWELVLTKDGAVRDVAKVMQLKGHKGAVYWLSFTDDSKRIVTSSKDGTIKVWNIDVRYQLDEDPRCLATFPCGLPAVGKAPPHYDRIAVAPGGALLAAAAGHTLHWLDLRTGAVLERAEHAHEGEISCLAWAPQPRGALILATGSTDKKVKLWKAPPVDGESK
ncbi:hypothetical protein KFL_004560050 [Klebsormidium nitens]|uniref:Uncharacterized protein n=1 Tax=Klebsormidium nitens TaxID=105231 RepID=A0A1Y1ICR2_KLENI|nr:hypothetical protein KFL_004560050 [Klebsormidium nitens]|eukprot:GAQ88744.1 hypothetical protein KFL_004560050 [Klebsormidium nitens]